MGVGQRRKAYHRGRGILWDQTCLWALLLVFSDKGFNGLVEWAIIC